MRSLGLFGHLELFKTGGYIFSKILVISFIILSEVEPGDKFSLKVKEIIVMLALHLFFHRIQVLYIFSSTWLLRLWILFEFSQNIFTSTFKGHIQTFLFFLFHNWKLFNWFSNTNNKRCWCLNFTLVMEKPIITESTILSFSDNCGQKVYNTFFLIKYCWLWLFDLFILDFSLFANSFHL